MIDSPLFEESQIDEWTHNMSDGEVERAYFATEVMGSVDSMPNVRHVYVELGASFPEEQLLEAVFRRSINDAGLSLYHSGAYSLFREVFPEATREEDFLFYALGSQFQESQILTALKQCRTRQSKGG